MEFNIFRKVSLILLAVFVLITAGFGAGKEKAKPAVKTKASVSSAAQVVDGFGIYSDTVSQGIEWDTDAKLDIWHEYDAGMNIEEEFTDAPEGTACWKLVGTGSWMGMGIRVEPLKQLRDMSAYSNGTLNFWAKSTKGFKIGVKSYNCEKWMTTSKLAQYGFVPDGKWHQVKIPCSAFTWVNFSKMEQLFMFVSDSTLRYSKKDVFYLDDIYYSK